MLCIAWMVAFLLVAVGSSSFSCTASTTTMASSTTVPMTSTKAKRVMRLSVNPTIYIKAKVPTSETIILTDGMMVARQFCRNRSTTRITSSKASNSVLKTAFIEASRKSLVSRSTRNSRPAGNFGFRFSMSRSISWFTCCALAPVAGVIMAIVPL